MSKIIRRSQTANFKQVILEDIDDLTVEPGSGMPPCSKPAGKPRQLTAAELEEIQQQAREEAYEAGRKEGFEFGHQEALEQYRQVFSQQVDAFNQVLTAFEKPLLDLDDQVEKEIVDLVISMVRQLIRREVKLEPNHVIGVVREALSILPVGSRHIKLFLNPEDAELIREKFISDPSEKNWDIVEDPVLERGGCRVIADDSQIDATLESRLDALIAPLLAEERSQNLDFDAEHTDDSGRGEAS